MTIPLLHPETKDGTSLLPYTIAIAVEFRCDPDRASLGKPQIPQSSSHLGKEEQPGRSRGRRKTHR